jgi:hypothetical protein
MIRLFKKAIYSIYASFTSVDFYRDVAYRQKGFGLQILWTVFFLLFIPSMIQHAVQTHYFLKHKWRQDLLAIPSLNLVNGQIIKRNQTPIVLNKINDLGHFSWIEDNKVPQHVPQNINYFFGNHYFLVRVPQTHWFGIQFDNNDLFLPVASWINLAEPINGECIYQAIGPATIFIISSLFIIFNLLMMFNISFCFVYSFSYVACKMIRLLINNYNPDRKMVCRLLCISMIPTLVLATVIMDTVPYKDYHKFMYIFFYMLNFNIAVRIVRQKSDVTMLDLRSKPDL